MSQGSQQGIFSSAPDAVRPLADRMRPATLDEYAGQTHLLAAGKPLRRAIEQDHLHSMVFWGPPGTGKTTLARLIAHYCHAHFIALSAVWSGIKEIRAAVDTARQIYADAGQRTVLFVDEVHRFNKTQQDAFLPYIEDGTLYFVGATTENPSFELNNALLSRVRVYVLKRIEQVEIVAILQRALSDTQKGLGALQPQIATSQLELIAAFAEGDARSALNILEIAADLAELQPGRRCITEEIISEITRQGVRRFDKGGDLFYEQISALHKSVRGSSPDAALYWLCRMLDGGCDPRYIARRIVRMATEDIGNADPRGLSLALAACETYERMGSPEGELAIAQAVVYLACAAKSNAVYTAFHAAMADAKSNGTLDVPAHLRNAPTGLMKALGHGQGYRYAHDEDDGYAAGEHYFPQEMQAQQYYKPVNRGLEIKIAEKLSQLRARDQQANKAGKP